MQDYSPDQPRDPHGRWSEGGGDQAAEQSKGINGESGTAETPRSLTIHPRASVAPTSSGAREQPVSGIGTSLLAKLGSALEFINSISPAHAAGAEEEESRSPEAEADPMAELRADRYASAYNELKAIDPANSEFGPSSKPIDWTPSNEDVQRVESALASARSGQGGSAAFRSLPRQGPESVSPFAPLSEQVDRPPLDQPQPMPVSPEEEMLERIARENPLRLNIGRVAVPEGAFGSIVRASGVTIRVDGSSPRELG